MPRPGTDVDVGATQEETPLSTSIATTFVLIDAERGPIDRPVEIAKREQITTLFGGRVAGAGTDCIETQFGEKASGPVYAIRLDDGGHAAKVNAGQVEIRAANPGTWGNNITVEIASAGQIVAAGIVDSSLPQLMLTEPSPPPAEPEESEEPEDGPGGVFGLAVYHAGERVEQALSLTDADSLIAWAEENSDFIRASAPDGTGLTAGVYELEDGADGDGPVTDPQKLLVAAMACGDEELGLAGVLIAPGKHGLVQHEALLRAGMETNRRAVLDANPALDIPGLEAHAKTLRTLDMAQAMGGLWCQRLFIPGMAAGGRRIVPASAVMASMMGRNANANQSAAGRWGIAQYATGLDRQFTARERERLLYAGVNTFVMRDGRPRNNAFRTLAAQDGPYREWVFFASSRLAMSIKAEALEIGDRFLHENNTPQTISNFLGALAAMVGEYWPDALYGATAEEAFEILDLNTLETIRAGERHAGIRVHMGTPAEWIYIQIDKVPLTTQFAVPATTAA